MKRIRDFQIISADVMMRPAVAFREEEIEAKREREQK